MLKNETLLKEEIIYYSSHMNILKNSKLSIVTASQLEENIVSKIKSGLSFGIPTEIFKKSMNKINGKLEELETYIKLIMKDVSNKKDINPSDKNLFTSLVKEYKVLKSGGYKDGIAKITKVFSVGLKIIAVGLMVLGAMSIVSGPIKALTIFGSVSTMFSPEFYQTGISQSDITRAMMLNLNNVNAIYASLSTNVAAYSSTMIASLQATISPLLAGGLLSPIGISILAVGTLVIIGFAIKKYIDYKNGKINKEQLDKDNEVITREVDKLVIKAKTNK